MMFLAYDTEQLPPNHCEEETSTVNATKKSFLVFFQPYQNDADVVGRSPF